MRTNALLFLGLAMVLTAGCASDRVVRPAQTIQTSISVFQTQLSLFQTSIKTLQSGEQSVIAANNVQLLQMPLVSWRSRLVRRRIFSI